MMHATRTAEMVFRRVIFLPPRILNRQHHALAQRNIYRMGHPSSDRTSGLFLDVRRLTSEGALYPHHICVSIRRRSDHLSSTISEMQCLAYVPAILGWRLTVPSGICKATDVSRMVTPERNLSIHVYFVLWSRPFAVSRTTRLGSLPVC